MVTLISTPIGNIGDISFRATTAIKLSQIVLCEDTRITRKLFSLIEKKLNTPLNIDDKKFIALHAHNENKFFENTNIDFNQNIIFASDAGSPCISDPGALLVDFCLKNNIKYDFIGGTSAFLAAFCMSGFLETSFMFHGFLPQKGKARQEKLENLLSKKIPVILYEAPHRIEKLIDNLCDIDSDRIIFAIKEISKLHQLSIKDKAINIKSKLKDISTKGEWVVVVSPKIQDTKGSAITLEDINSLDLPPKQKAKLIAKLSGENIKTCYEALR